MEKRTLFEDLMQGLTEAIEYEKGFGEAHKTIYTIRPVQKYSATEIRDIRIRAGMTQKTLALYMGGSLKTVEVCEGGRTHPTGPACRLLYILATDDKQAVDYIIER